MFLGLLVGLGCNVDSFERRLATLANKPWRLSSTLTHRSGFEGQLVEVIGGDLPMTLDEMSHAIMRSLLPQGVKELSLDALRRIREAEEQVHGVGDVHLHELGTLDTLIDIAGAFLGLEMLGVEAVVLSEIAVGAGVIETVHGVISNPGPAVAQILTRSANLRVRLRREEFEFLTPTGAAILSAISDSALFVRSVPSFVLQKAAYGAGNKDPGFGPNLLQGLLGGTQALEGSATTEVAVLSVHLDDITGESVGGLVDEAIKVGAYDAWITNVLGKKSRPGYEVTLLVPSDNLVMFLAWLHRRTRSPGIRVRTEWRSIHEPAFRKEVIDGLEVSVKTTSVSEKVEFDEASAVAMELGLTVEEVQEMILGGVRSRSSPESK